MRYTKTIPCSVGPSVYGIDTMFEFDKRIKKYEEKCEFVDGKGGVVSVDPGTRIYREVGNEITLQAWMDDVQTAFDGELVPFEWVADYVGVTRAALHKRVKKGKLTVLVYEMRENVLGVLGGIRERMRREYKYVPKKECESWYEELLEKEPHRNVN